MSTRAEVEAILPVGPAQRGMLYYSVLHPGEGAYLEQLRVSLAGALRPEALRRAWELVVARHGALRSLFAWEHRDQPLQVIRRAVELPWTQLDWRGQPEAEHEERLARLLVEDRAAGLRLDRAPVLRLALVRRADDRWEMVWTFHHVLLDGWSMSVVLGEVWTAYRADVEGRTPELPAAPSLRDYAAWLGRQDEAADRAFWTRALAGLERPFALPLPGGDPALDPALAGAELRAEVVRSLSGADLERLQAFARAQDLTLSALTQGAWALLLRRYSGSRRVAFGAVASGRPPDLPGVERLAGVFMNALPAWVEVPGEARSAAWLRELQTAQAEARDHGHHALEEIQGWLGLPRREAPFDTLVIFENYPTDPAAMGGLPDLEITGTRMRERGAFPVSLYLLPRRDALHLRLDYRRDRLGDRAAERLMDYYLSALRGLAENPERRLRDLPVMAEEERRLLSTWAAGAPLPAAAGSRPVHALFAETARDQPEAVAVVDGARHVSYGHLAACARAVARSLSTLPGAVAPGEIVALLADRSAEMLAGMLGILEAGAAYLPIDPATPADRIAYMLDDAGVQAVVSRRELVPKLPALLAPTAESLPEADAQEAPNRVRPLVSAPGADAPGAPDPARLAVIATEADVPEATDRSRVAQPAVVSRRRFPAGEKATPAEPLGRLSKPKRGLLTILLDETTLTPDPPADPSTHTPAIAPESLAYVIYTSGSTGRPKGVLVEHRNLASYTAVAAAEQAIAPGVRTLQFASIAFDTSAEEIWPCLTRGGTLVLRDDRALGGPRELERALAEWRPEVLDLPTAFWHQLAAALAAGELALPASVRLVVIGGERALGERLADWRRGLGDAADRVRLLNTYGPTETTIVAVAAPVGAGDGPGDPAIGRPVAGARAVVLGPDLEPVPPGMAGELAIGGTGVSRGYLGRPAQTAERFVPDPAAGSGPVPAGARLYRTGDLAAWRDEGRLEFRGRLDDQLKVRGYRVEPGEIESVLAAHPTVREAVVAPWRPGEGAELRLAAYVVPDPAGPAPAAAALRAHLEERLPEYMVPAAYVLLDELPRTTSGKLDRGALPEPGPGDGGAGGRYAAPRTPVEELLAGWWSELLGVERVGVDDDFFRLGGHSLLVGRLAARVRRELGVELPLIDVFQHPTLGELAARVAGGEAGATGAPELPPLVPADRTRPLPLSYQQERVWFLQNLVPGTVAYNFQLRMRFLGALDVGLLERALSEIVRRHEVLRTGFPELDGEPRQVVHLPWAVRLPVTDLRHLGELERAQAASDAILEEEVAKPFDVASPPLVRWRLVRLADDHHQLVQVEHHFVHDGWSIALLLGELKALYSAFAAGEPSPLPELALQYGDFAVWQRSWMEGEVMDGMLGYWREKLAGAPTRLDLPADRPRPPRATLAGDAVRELLPAELYRDLRAFGRREGFTLFMTMMAAFQALLHRCTGAPDFLVGMGIANRRVAELEPLIGMMVNSLVLRADLGGEPTFRELLERVRRTTLEAYAHQDMPFERLVGELAPERDASRNPLFQVMFSFHDAAVPDLDFAGLQAGFLVEHNRSAKTDLNVIVAPRAEQRTGRTTSAADDRAVVTWEFSTDLFDRDRIERLIGHYYTLAAAALADPDRRLSELPLLPPAEEARVLREWSGRRTGYPRDRSLVELFAERAAERGDAPAVRFGGQEIGYRELDRRAARIARRLRQLGVGRGTPVALAVERSAELVPAVLGILGAGGFYVPLDAGYPKERLAFMLADSGAPVVVAERSLLDRLPETAARVLCLDDPVEAARLAALPAARPAVELGGEDAAYLVYTSGSTGRPKGVVVPHRAVARLVLDADFARFGPDETFLQLAPLSFDAATLELWAPLLTGGRLVVAPPGPPTLEDLGRLLAVEGITTLWLTAGLFHQVVQTDPAALAPLRQLLAGGDVLSPEDCRRALAACPGLVLIDGYGPTENTTFTACHPMASPAEVAEPVPIGRPIADTRVFVTDAALRPVPPGVPGELVAGGDGLARGYWRRPALTAERFVPDPLSGEPGSRLYRTGDRARWLAAGRLEFLGRFDSQVKIRGFRIEPGEVEAALSACPGVAEAAVVVVETDGDKALAACLVAAGDGESLAPAALRAFLEERLPPHALPQRFLALDRMPLTPNGKVDRRELSRRAAEAGAAPPVAPEGHLAPRTRLEQALAEIWTGFLPVARVGVRDDFFDLGGHSLIATRIVSRIRRELSVDMSLGAFFEAPTVERLARLLEDAGARVPDRAPAPSAASASDPWGLDDELLGRADSLADHELDALLGRMLAEQER